LKLLVFVTGFALGAGCGGNESESPLKDGFVVHFNFTGAGEKVSTGFSGFVAFGHQGKISVPARHALEAKKGMRVQDPYLTIMPSYDTNRDNDFTFRPKPKADCVYIGYQEGLRLPKPFKIRKFLLNANEVGQEAVWTMNVRVRELFADAPELPETERTAVMQTMAAAYNERNAILGRER